MKHKFLTRAGTYLIDYWFVDNILGSAGIA